MTDMVNHPPHYTQGNVECIDAIEAALGHLGYIGFLQGQIIKYTWRMNHKDKQIEDTQKAIWYARKLEDFLVRLEKNKEMEDLETSTICEVLDTQKRKPFPKMFYANLYEKDEIVVGGFFDDLNHCKKVGHGSCGRIHVWVSQAGEYYTNLYKIPGHFKAGPALPKGTVASDFKYDEGYIKTIRFSV